MLCQYVYIKLGRIAEIYETSLKKYTEMSVVAFARCVTLATYSKHDLK